MHLYTEEPHCLILYVNFGILYELPSYFTVVTCSFLTDGIFLSIRFLQRDQQVQGPLTLLSSELLAG